MAAYLIAFIDVKDPEQYAGYTKHTPRVIAEFGGRMLVRGGNPATLEGTSPGPRCIVAEFADRAAIETFYRSPQYQALIPLRQAAASGHLITVDGLPPALWDEAVIASRKHG
jgi:uncharacterized protein (DUF1330 family)